jgi:cation diffusion facilitator CzcD-associated flavoprotein CzcO
MQREERERNLHKKRKDRYRERHTPILNDAQCDGKVTPPSPTPSPTPSPKNKTYSAIFLRFWEAYPLKKARPTAFKAWLKKKPNIETVLKAIKAQTLEKENLVSQNKFCPEWPHPATWLNNERWEDEIEDGTGELDPVERIRRASEIDRQKKLANRETTTTPGEGSSCH